MQRFKANIIIVLLILIGLIISGCASKEINENNENNNTSEVSKEIQTLVNELKAGTKVLEDSIQQNTASVESYNEIQNKLVKIQDRLSSIEKIKDIENDNLMEIIDYIDKVLKLKVDITDNELKMARINSINLLSTIQDKLNVPLDVRRVDELEKEGVIVEVQDGTGDVGSGVNSETTEDGVVKDEAYYTEKAKEELKKMEGDLRAAPVEKTDRILNKP